MRRQQASHPRRAGQALLLAWLCAGCHSEPKRQAHEGTEPPPVAMPEPRPTPLAEAVTPTALPTRGAPAAAVPLAPAASEPTAEPPPPLKPHLDVTVSDLPAQGTETEVRLLAGYERLGKRRNPERLEISTDRNSAEFPGSHTRAVVTGVTVPPGVGAVPVGQAKAQAMQLKFTLEQQKTPFAGCDRKSGCGCAGIVPYAYLSLAHALPPGVRLDEYKHLSFWAKSAAPFDLHVVLSCYVEARPDAGFRDLAHKEMDPCWHPTRVQRQLPEPVPIRGDGQWHRYQFRIDDLPPPEKVFLKDGGPMACTVDNVTEVSYVFEKNEPPVQGEYPGTQGIVWFDQLQAVGTR